MLEGTRLVSAVRHLSAEGSPQDAAVCTTPHAHVPAIHLEHPSQNQTYCFIHSENIMGYDLPEQAAFYTKHNHYSLMSYMIKMTKFLKCRILGNAATCSPCNPLISAARTTSATPVSSKQPCALAVPRSSMTYLRSAQSTLHELPSVRGSHQSSVHWRPLTCPGELAGQLQNMQRKRCPGKEERGESPQPSGTDKEG